MAEKEPKKVEDQEKEYVEELVIGLTQTSNPDLFLDGQGMLYAVQKGMEDNYYLTCLSRDWVEVKKK